MSDTAAPGGREFTKTELLGYLAEVDAEFPVPDSGEPVEIAVIGGAAIGFLVPGRVTDDVDAISEGMPEKLRVAAAAGACWGFRGVPFRAGARLGGCA